MDCNALSLTSEFDSGVVLAEPQRKSGSLPLITKRRKNRKGASSHFLVEALGCVITRVLDETSGAPQPSFQRCNSHTFPVIVASSCDRLIHRKASWTSQAF